MALPKGQILNLSPGLPCHSRVVYFEHSKDGQNTKPRFKIMRLGQSQIISEQRDLSGNAY